MFFFVKVDIGKAYDNMIWSFMNCILHDIDLLDKLIRMIMASITYVDMNILWNGIGTSYFTLNKLER